MTDRVDDAELVARAEQGDRAAFEQLVERYYAVAASAAFTILNDREAARDCAQEAFLEAARKLNTLREKSKFGAWIYGIARQQAIYILRRQKLHSQALQVKSDESRAQDRSDHLPAEQAKKQEKLESIRRALNEVPEIYREVLILKYIDGRSHEEIAKILDLSMAAVDKRLMRGKELLRESLRRWNKEE